LVHIVRICKKFKFRRWDRIL